MPTLTLVAVWDCQVQTHQTYPQRGTELIITVVQKNLLSSIQHKGQALTRQRQPLSHRSTKWERSDIRSQSNCRQFDEHLQGKSGDVFQHQFFVTTTEDCPSRDPHELQRPSAPSNHQPELLSTTFLSEDPPGLGTATTKCPVRSPIYEDSVGSGRSPIY